VPSIAASNLWPQSAPQRRCASPAPFSDTVYTGPSQQSEVVLGLIPGATAKAPLPRCGTIIGEPCRANQTPVPSGSLAVPGTR
jgi:hypothetical protein